MSHLQQAQLRGKKACAFLVPFFSFEHLGVSEWPVRVFTICAPLIGVMFRFDGHRV